MSEITPVSLDSLIAQYQSAQSATVDRSNTNEKQIEKAFVSLLVENLNLMNMASISGNSDSSSNDSLMFDQIFKDWLIGQDLGFSQQLTNNNKE